MRRNTSDVLGDAMSNMLTKFREKEMSSTKAAEHLVEAMCNLWDENGNGKLNQAELGGTG